jgi:hypothetical protein
MIHLSRCPRKLDHYSVHESRISDYANVCEFIELAMLEKLGALKDSLFDASTLPHGPFDLEF